MKRLALGLSLVLSVVLYRDTHAQDFWYTPPGLDYGYYYGINLGSGVGFGYGAGIGVPLSWNQLASANTGAAIPAQEWCGSDDASVAPHSQGIPSTAAVTVPKKPAKATYSKQKTAGVPGKKNGKIATAGKPVTPTAGRGRTVSKP